jgi:hypothetical protein
LEIQWAAGNTSNMTNTGMSEVTQLCCSCPESAPKWQKLRWLYQTLRLQLMLCWLHVKAPVRPWKSSEGEKRRNGNGNYWSVRRIMSRNSNSFLVQWLWIQVTTHSQAVANIFVSRQRVTGFNSILDSWSQWRRGLRRRSAAAWLLGSRVWIPLGTWMFVSCICMLCCHV